MKGKLLLVTLFAACAAAEAPAADNGAAAKPHMRLAYFVGRWDVAVHFRLPNGKEGDGKADCRTDWILGENFVRQAYDSHFMGQPLLIWQLLGYDSAAKTWVEFQLHAQGKTTHTFHSQGAFSDDGKVLTLSGDSVNSFTGKMVKLRTATTVSDNDHYTLEWFMTEPGGKEERTVVLRHTRKK